MRPIRNPSRNQLTEMGVTRLRESETLMQAIYEGRNFRNLRSKEYQRKLLTIF